MADFRAQLLGVVFCASILGCGDSPRSETEVVRILTGNRVAGIQFEPMTVRPGERIGAMTLDSIEVRVAFDSTRVGTARFSGQAELSGWTLRHPEADLRDVDLCFEADSTSAARLPRWRGDERRAWFCFENQTEAKQMLGPPSDSTPATVIIDRFNLRRGLTDEVNSARLVRVPSQ